MPSFKMLPPSDHSAHKQTQIIKILHHWLGFYGASDNVTKLKKNIPLHIKIIATCKFSK